MKLHRFYIHEMHNKYGPVELAESVWIHNEHLLNQWLKVLRYKVGDELVLFNDKEERLYAVKEIEFPHSVKLGLITELDRQVPEKRVTLLWALLKNDKNDWVIQKATELGVHEFVPIITGRSEKQTINIERSYKIIIEAAEQCGRADIPKLRDPILLHEALKEYGSENLYVCEQTHHQNEINDELNKAYVLVGPEGGWTDEEKKEFVNSNFKHLKLARFTLRAETACIIAVSKLLN